MTRTPSTQWPQLASPPRWRRTARVGIALLLRGASAALANLASRLSPDDAAADTPTLEFHANAGAPEGALYVDGVLIGYLPGVNRL